MLEAGRPDYIYAPVMMIAEKAADLILGHTPLPPEHVPFYQHGREQGERNSRGAAKPQ